MGRGRGGGRGRREGGRGWRGRQGLEGDKGGGTKAGELKMPHAGKYCQKGAS